MPRVEPAVSRRVSYLYRRISRVGEVGAAGGEPLWYPSYLEVAELSHFAIACAVIFGAVALGGSGKWAAVGVTAFALVKEFVFDILVEKDTWGYSALDFAFYVLGTAASLGALYLKNQYGG